MRVAFFQGGSRWKFDKEGNQYTDANLNQSIWDRYLAHVDAICVVLREDRQIYSSSIAHASFNEFDSNKIQSVVLPDLYQPRVNMGHWEKYSAILKQ